MKQRTENLMTYILIPSAFVISLITFIIAPFTEDIYVLFAGSHQADMLGGNIITNPVMQWDLKGIFFRLSIYIIYRCVNPFVNLIGSGTSFCIAANVLFCASVIALITFSVIIASGNSKCRKIFLIILALCTAIFASLPWTHMQAEMMCTVKLIFAFSVYINAQRTKSFFRTKLFISGFLAAWIVFYKSIFVMMALPFAAGIYLYSMKNDYTLSFRQFMFIFWGGVTAVIFVMVMIICINPGEIQNMLDAAVYQPSIFQSHASVLDSLKRFVRFSAHTVLAIPAVLLGLVCGAGNFVNDIRRKNHVGIILRLFLWIVPTLMIIIADRYFVYHYFMFVPGSVLEICLSDRETSMAAGFSLTFSAVIYVCFMSIFSPYIRESINLTEETYAESMTTLSELNIAPSETVMYLDDGFGAYLIGNKSWLDEYYALPLQRVNEDSDHPSHVKALRKALDYRGRFITVFEGWFYGKDNNRKIKDKISSEYVKRGTIALYTFGHSMFAKPSRKGTLHEIDIYERINGQ